MPRVLRPSKNYWPSANRAGPGQRVAQARVTFTITSSTLPALHPCLVERIEGQAAQAPAITTAPTRRCRPMAQRATARCRRAVRKSRYRSTWPQSRVPSPRYPQLEKQTTRIQVWLRFELTLGIKFQIVFWQEFQLFSTYLRTKLAKMSQWEKEIVNRTWTLRF